MSLPSGTKLDGYEILSSLGSGGMGEVYRAYDPVLKRDVAIKVLQSIVSQDPDRLRRFEQEAQAAAALNHPNILAVYRFGVFEGAPYLVSELLEGDTLRRQLERGPLSVRKAINIGVQIAHGLAAAHEKGIVHRDLKPENLFVTKDGRVKILDFGLAKLTQRPTEAASDETTQAVNTDPGMVMGTVGYMAPEQVRGKPVDHRADIFAFGAILYEMLAGRRAFQRSTPVETLSAILNDDPPSLSQTVQISQNSQITPPGLQRVVHRCLEKSPEQRFQSASDLAFALEASSDSDISSGSAVAQDRRKPRRLLLASAGAVAVFALGACGYFFVVSQNKAAPLRISEYTQLTHSGQAGGLTGTDGSRLYLSPDIRHPITQVSVTGGEIEPVPIPVPNPLLLDVSPDGATFLVQSYEKGLTSTTPLWSVRILGGSHRYLVDAAGGAWTPDGKSVAYFMPNGDVNLIQADGTGDHKLVNLGGIPLSFVWSPNGKVIRYSIEDKFWEMASNGSNVHQLLADWHPSSRKYLAGWSPDGNCFVFVSNHQIWALDERRGLFHRPSEQPFQLTSSPIHWEAPVFSHDGKTLFANGSTDRGQLTRFDVKSKQLQPFLGGISADHVEFSRDGKSVVYMSYPDRVLWRANVDGSDRVQITGPPLKPAMPHWSPDGSRILFSDFSEPLNRVPYTVSSQGGKPQRLLPDDTTSDRDPNWSPDGAKVVFASSAEGDLDPKVTIRILDVATGKVSTLPGSVGMTSPRWSPDGQSISSQNFTAADLHIFDIKTQRWSTVYRGPVGFAVWSGDSRFIFFWRYAGDPAILRVSAKGGEAETIVDLKDFTPTGIFNIWLGLDPTGAPMLLRDAGASDVYALTLERK